MTDAARCRAPRQRGLPLDPAGAVQCCRVVDHSADGCHLHGLFLGRQISAPHTLGVAGRTLRCATGRALDAQDGAT